MVTRSNLTASEVRKAIRKIRRRINDLEDFDCGLMDDSNDPRIKTLEAAIKGTLRDVFGLNTSAFRSYQAAATINTDGLISGLNAVKPAQSNYYTARVAPSKRN
jgi:hypothetical protein